MAQIQEIFYWTASIVLILTGLFIISLFGLLFYLKRTTDKALIRIYTASDHISEHVAGAARTWKNLAFTRLLFRALKIIF